MASKSTPYTAVASPLTDSRTVPKEYLFMPETHNLFWNDDFFDDEEGTVAVFDFDYEEMERFYFQVAIVSQIVFFSYLLIIGGLIFGALGLLFGVGIYGLTLNACFLQSQVRWDVRAKHLAITRDGIRFVHDKRKSGWGLSMCDRGKQSKTVPFDKITDCDIEEPAGNACLCFIPRVLFNVHVDTASSGSESKSHELTINGLKEPHRFKALVWAMKRSALSGGGGLPMPSLTGAPYQPPAPVRLEMADRGTAASVVPSTYAGTTSDNSNVTELLVSIRDELRENNKLLKSMNGSNNPTDITQPPVAAVAESLAAALEQQAMPKQVESV